MISPYRLMAIGGLPTFFGLLTSEGGLRACQHTGRALIWSSRKLKTSFAAFLERRS